MDGSPFLCVNTVTASAVLGQLGLRMAKWLIRYSGERHWPRAPDRPAGSQCCLGLPASAVWMARPGGVAPGPWSANGCSWHEEACGQTHTAPVAPLPPISGVTHQWLHHLEAPLGRGQGIGCHLAPPLPHPPHNKNSTFHLCPSPSHRASKTFRIPPVTESVVIHNEPLSARPEVMLMTPEDGGW